MGEGDRKRKLEQERESRRDRGMMEMDFTCSQLTFVTGWA